MARADVDVGAGSNGWGGIIGVVAYRGSGLWNNCQANAETDAMSANLPQQQRIMSSQDVSYAAACQPACIQELPFSANQDTGDTIALSVRANQAGMICVPSFPYPLHWMA